MSPPNRNALWARVLVDELHAAGLESVCLTPGSRCTPLTVAFHEHDGVETFSHLDERSSAFFALGRARRSGSPVGLVCTSGTAAANYHPAVIEADRGRVPLVLLTADRPPELRDSGANQTVEQRGLYGDAVRWFRELPEPDPADRTLRRLRVDAGRAVAAATGSPAGPVHVNVPFRKPLAPVESAEDLPAIGGEGPDRDAAVDDAAVGDAGSPAAAAEDPAAAAGLGSSGRTGGFVDYDAGTTEPPDAVVADLADAVDAADRVLVVAGPATPAEAAPSAVADLASACGAPLLADPLSGCRFGHHVAGAPGADPDLLVCGGYDAYLATEAARDWPAPELVLRVGVSPTSKPLRKYLATTGARQVLIDRAGEWREAEFTATDHVTADAGATARALAGAIRERGVDSDAAPRRSYRERFARAERRHWELVDDVLDGPPAAEATAADGPEAADARELPAADELEGAVLPAVFDAVPDTATILASNGMPVRDLDRFARPERRSITALGNRGASGIDGITSTALGAATASAGPLVAVVGDLAYYHDSNGLLAAARCGVDATIVLVNNDGGGIFHALPIEEFDPPFTDLFVTPHGIDFSPTGDLYDFDYRRVDGVGDLTAACERAVGSDGLDVLEVVFDAEGNHRGREALQRELEAALSAED